MHATLPIALDGQHRSATAIRAWRWLRLGPAFLGYGVAVAVYVVFAGTATSRSSGDDAADAPYNRLVDGMLLGHLYLDREVPAAILACPNPYDPRQLGRARGLPYTPESIHDLSYFRGHFYLYFSVIPAAVLFLPYHVITDSYLSQQYACALFLALGLAFVARTIVGLWNESFAEVRPVVVGAAVLAVGLVPCTPLVVERPDMYEVAICAAYFFNAMAVYALWRIARRPPKSVAAILLLATSTALAAGCRPSEISIVALIAIGFTCYWRGGFAGGVHRWRLLAAAMIPVAMVGAALLAYNYARFGDAAEFGVKYQLNLDRPDVPRFNFANLAYNGWMYLLHFPGWSTHFPFAGPWQSRWTLPATVTGAEGSIGLFSALPFVLLAFVALARWRSWASSVSWVAGSVVWIAATNALVLGLFVGNAARYQLSFAPSLVLVAVLGLFSTELALGAVSHGARAGARIAWVALLAFSVAYPVLLAYRQRGDTWLQRAVTQMWLNNQTAVIECCDHALQHDPDAIAPLELKAASEAHLGRSEDALRDFKQIVTRQPLDVNAWNYLGAITLFDSAHAAESVGYFRHALELTPNQASAHFNLAQALLQTGHPVAQAIPHLRVALRLQPDLEPARQLLWRLEFRR